MRGQGKLGLVAASLAGVVWLGPPAVSETTPLTAIEESIEGNGRRLDQATNPEYLQLVVESCAGLAPDPAGCIADPYRTLDRWSPAYGTAMIFSFANRYGAMLKAEIFSPRLPFVDPVTGVSSNGPFPAVVVIPGHQEPRQEYRWAAQGLAESGYIVVAFDPQGFGESDVHPNPQSEYCDPNGPWRQPQEMGITEQGACAGEPPADYVNLVAGQVVALAVGDWSGAEEIYRQQSPNFIFGALDTLAWLLSPGNPWRARVDATRVGVAGHSLGAYAAMMVGNGDPAGRFDAAVAWDGYNPLTHGVAPTVPTLLQQSQQQEALGATYVVQPNPEGFHPTRATYRDFGDACVAAGFIVPNASSHHEWAYGTGYGASSFGERVGHYFTLAWFDRYLKGKMTGVVRGDEAVQAANATARLTAATFDGSADRSSRGAGAWDPVAMRNVPHAIAGQPIAGRLSPYYSSQLNTSPC